MAKLDYYNRTEKGLSYSRRLTLHACPHKFELSGKFAMGVNDNSVTFAYGHSVAMGMQRTIAGDTLNQAVIASYMEYDHTLTDKGTNSEQAAKKSVHHAVLATEEFWKLYNAGTLGFLKGWEVAKFTDPTTGEVKLGIELTYVIHIGNGYTDEGHIDLILYNPKLNRYMIVEIKTTGSYVVDPAQFKYSDQPLGYGIVLDAIAAQEGATSSFDVLYLVWKSRSRELVTLPFTKTVRDRARWVNELLLDVQYIDKCETEGHYPHRGESCFNWQRPCEHFTYCKMSPERLRRLSNANTDDDDEFAELRNPDFFFNIEELLDRQDKLVALIEAGGTAQAEKDSVELHLSTIDVMNV